MVVVVGGGPGDEECPHNGDGVPEATPEQSEETPGGEQDAGDLAESPSEAVQQ